MIEKNSVFSQIYQKENIEAYNIELAVAFPSWIRQFVVNNAESYAEIDSGIKFLLVENQLFVEEDKVTKFTRNIRQVFNIQGVEECSNILLDFNPQKHSVHIHAIFVKRNNEILDKLSSADIRVLQREQAAENKVLTGEATLSIILDHIKINDILEVSYSMVNFDLLESQFFSRLFNLEYMISLYQLHLVVIADEKNELASLILGSEDTILRENENGKTILTCRKDKISGKKVERFLPYWYPKVSYWHVSLKKSYQDIALEQLKFYGILETVEPALVGLINEIRALRLNPEKIILHALNFISKNIRYLSNYRATDCIRPSNPNLTTSRLYGDCKDFVYLLRHILNEFNIANFPVLVNSAMGRSLNKFLPAMSLFDHVIILVEFDGYQYFIDPTSRQILTSLEYFYLFNYGYGLVCREDTTQLSLIQNNNSRKAFISIVDHYEILSMERKKIAFKAKVIFEGGVAFKFINYLDNHHEKKAWETISEYYSKYMKIEEIYIKEIDYSEVGKNKISYCFEFLGEFKLFYENSSVFRYQIAVMDIMDSLEKGLPQEINSDFYYGQKISLDYKIKIKDRTPNDSYDSELSVKDEGFNFSKFLSSSGKEIKIEYKFEKLKEVIEKEKYKTFYENYFKSQELLLTQVNKRKSKNFLRGTGGLLAYIAFICTMILTSKGCQDFDFSEVKPKAITQHIANKPYNSLEITPEKYNSFMAHSHSKS